MRIYNSKDFLDLPEGKISRKPNACKFVVPLCDVHVSDNEKSADVWLEPDYFSDAEVFKLCNWFMRLSMFRANKRKETRNENFRRP